MPELCGIRLGGEETGGIASKIVCKYTLLVWNHEIATFESQNGQILVISYGSGSYL